MSINLNNQFKEAPGLSQQFFAAGTTVKKPLSSEGQFRPTSFSRTYQASRSGETLITIGTGQVDPANHARIVLQLSHDAGITVMELVDRYKALMFKLSYEPELLRRSVAFIVGGNDRPVRASNLPSLPASAIIDNLLSVLNMKSVSYVDEVLVYLVADALIAMYAQLGLVSHDAPHIHRLRPGNLSPSYNDLVEIVSLRDIMFMGTHLANADMGLMAKSIQKENKAISPTMLTQQLQNNFVMAYESAKGSYAATDIVNSVLSTLHRVWSPMTPNDFMPRERVMNSSFMSEFQSNLALFLATQDMVRNHPDSNVISFTDEEMTSFVFQFFSETMAMISPYKLRALSDSVDFFGMKASRDHNGEPGHIFLYEDWKVQDDVEAFLPIRQTLTSVGRFLLDMPAAGAALTNALGPVQKVVSLVDSINIRVDSYNMQDQTKRAANPTELHIAFPSIEVREAELETTQLNALQPFVFGQTMATPDDLKKIGVSERDMKALQYDYYSSIMHLAVSRGGLTSVGELSPVVTDGAHTMGPLFIMWNIRTPYTRQRGLSALLNGEVITTEPLEVIAYMDDFSPTSTLQVTHPVLKDHENAIHLWDWHRYSSKLSLSAAFEVTLRNKRYTVNVDEHEMLALGARRNEVRFMNLYDTQALVRIALKSIIDDHKFVVAEAAAAKDDLIREAYKGREIQSVLRLVAMLSSIASNGVGQRAITYAKQRIADAMYGKTGTLDGYDEIHVGVQNHRMKVWAGIRVLELLNLISDSDATTLSVMIKDSNALAYALSTVELSSYK